jgi:GTPase SAR1 family protein
MRQLKEKEEQEKKQALENAEKEKEKAEQEKKATEEKAVKDATEKAAREKAELERKAVEEKAAREKSEQKSAQENAELERKTAEARAVQEKEEREKREALEQEGQKKAAEEKAKKEATEKEALEKAAKESGKVKLPPGTRQAFDEVLASGASAPLGRAKATMAGPGRAGKSATVRSLLGKKFDPNLESTVGADASQSCVVERTGQIVGWKEKQESHLELAEHAARAVAARLVAAATGASSSASSTTNKRGSVMGMMGKSETKPATPSAAAAVAASAPSKPAETKPPAQSSAKASEKPPVPSASTPVPTSREQTQPRRASFVEQAANMVRRMSASLTGGDSSKSSEPEVKKDPNLGSGEPVIVPVENVAIKDDQAMMCYDENLVGEAMNMANSGDEKGKIALSIWDLGGQDVFYALHHLYLTRYGVYLCIFDMRAMTSSDEKVRAESMNYTNFWLRSIQMHAPGAPVFLIGTFKDVVPSLEKHEEIDAIFARSLKPLKLCPTLVLNEQDNLAFWPIDNTKGGADEVIVRLRTAILESVGKMDFISMKIPLAWTMMLDKMMATKKRNITMREVIDIAEHQCGITNRAHVTGMLRLFHELGMLLYFEKTAELREIVVLDPQWLVDAITMVIRDFKLHPYLDKKLQSDLRHKYADEFQQLVDNAITSVGLLHRLWKGEDSESETDLTRRKFLASLMEDMTLSCPWRFGEQYAAEGDEDDKDVMRNLPPPNAFLISCNLRLFREKAIEDAIRGKIEKNIFTIDLDSLSEKKSSRNMNMFVVDFSSSFLPIGFFDRLICLLVAHSSVVFKESRQPLVAHGTVLLSFGMNDFRVDENLEKNRIIVTIGADSDHILILSTIESMVGKLRDEVMGSKLTFRMHLVVWKDGGKDHSLVDLDKAREAVAKKMAKIRDTSEAAIQTKEFISWIVSSSVSTNMDDIPKMAQETPTGKTYHMGLACSGSAKNLAETISMIQTELSALNVKIAPAPISQQSVTASICIALILSDSVFSDASVLDALRLVFKLANEGNRIPVILLQEGGTDPSLMIDRAPDDIRAMFSNYDTPVLIRRRFHERVVFVRELYIKIQDAHARSIANAEAEQAKQRGYLTFMSHYKREAGVTARLMQEHLERRCGARKDEKPQYLNHAKIFLDSDNLSDLRLLLEDVKRTKVLTVMLTKNYFTRPWCLAELHTALEHKIPMVTVNLADGSYDRDEAKNFLATLTPESLAQVSGKFAPEVMESLGIDVRKLGQQLAEMIPKIIEVSFNPQASRNMIAAGIDDLIDRILAHCN